MKYKINGRVRFSEVEQDKKISLPAIINYFQDCSTFQSEELGVGFADLASKNKAWVLSAWQIILNRRPEFGEDIVTYTWATDFQGLYGVRNFEMKDAKEESVAYANSIWVYMDLATGRPCRPSEEQVQLYGVEDALEMEYAPRKIALPKECQEGPAFPVRHYHIDTNGHVNNCQYVQMALEVLNQGTQVEEIHQIRVEYKKAAVFGDIILPKIAVSEERTVVELCQENGTVFAVVEFK
ncbi:acyl-[acyl-carrier-protein] thioesterase [Lachnospiraceae bacterium OttesenSCG-928-E19]|nr:acyl-[acyl-carrier-protein] thioesterase [Lachnospiraceae bacterium OttesenSCG-928-E19]